MSRIERDTNDAHGATRAAASSEDTSSTTGSGAASAASRPTTGATTAGTSRRGMSASGLARAAVLGAGAAAIALAAHAASPVTDPAQPTSVARGSAAPSPVDSATLVCAGGGATAQAAPGTKNTSTKDAGSKGATAESASLTSTIAVASAPRDVASMVRAGGSLTQRVVTGDASPVTMARGTSTSLSASGGPVALTASGELAPGLSATQFLTQGEALAAGPCSAAATEAWIPVGDKQAGRLLTLVLVNSGSHTASVDVDVRAADGEVAGAAIVDKAVPAHSRVEMNVAADAVTHAAPVVHVRSEGGAVQASVRDSSDTGDVRGVDQVGQVTPAATTQSIPAVAVVGGRARVRLVAPDGKAAVVRLQAWGVGDTVSHDAVATVPAGRSVDVDLSGLRGDVAAVRATSEREVVASALGASAAKGAKDFAWSPAAPDIADAAGASLVGVDHDGVLAVMSDGHARRVTIAVEKGGSVTTSSHTLPTRGAFRMPVAKGSTVWVTAPTRDGVSGVSADLLVRDGGKNGALASVPLVAAPWTRTPIAVVQG